MFCASLVFCSPLAKAVVLVLAGLISPSPGQMRGLGDPGEALRRQIRPETLSRLPHAAAERAVVCVLSSFPSLPFDHAGSPTHRSLPSIVSTRNAAGRV